MCVLIRSTSVISNEYHKIMFLWRHKKNNNFGKKKAFYLELWGKLRGWLCVAKVSCILCHRGVQLILAYSRTRLAILVAGKGRGKRVDMS